MLLCGLVPQQFINDLLEAFDSSLDVNGPSLVDDASIQLMQTVVQTLARVRMSSTNGFSERLLAWMFGKWRPGQSYLI